MAKTRNTAFLPETEKPTGSRRTVDACCHMLQPLFGNLGKTPDEVTAQDVFATRTARRPLRQAALPVTIYARLACLGAAG